jgi:hypothetical protein
MRYRPYTHNASHGLKAFLQAASHSISLTRRNALAGAAGLLLNACSPSRPTIEFTRVPPADKGVPMRWMSLRGVSRERSLGNRSLCLRAVPYGG